MKGIFSYKLYMNINYKTQAMIRYLSNEVLLNITQTLL